MRNKVIALIIVMIGLSLLLVGIISNQFGLFASFYEQMAAIG